MSIPRYYTRLYSEIINFIYNHINTDLEVDITNISDKSLDIVLKNNTKTFIYEVDHSGGNISDYTANDRKQEMQKALDSREIIIFIFHLDILLHSTRHRSLRS